MSGVSRWLPRNAHKQVDKQKESDAPKDDGASPPVKTVAFERSGPALQPRQVDGVTTFEAFVDKLRDNEGRLVDRLNGRATYAPGSPEEEAYVAQLRKAFAPDEWAGTREGAPRASGLTTEMLEAVSKGMAAYSEAHGVEVERVGTRKTEEGGHFWHRVRTDLGEPMYQTKPAGAIEVPDEPGQWVQGEFGNPRWCVVPATEEAEALQKLAPDPQSLKAEVERINAENEARNVPVRWLVRSDAVVKMERVVADVDLVYAAKKDGSPLPDSEVVKLGEHINAEYRAEGNQVDLVRHGAHFEGMKKPEYNGPFDLTRKYAHDPVFHVGDEGYLGATPLLPTFETVYQEPNWPTDAGAARSTPLVAPSPTSKVSAPPVLPQPEATKDVRYEQLALELE